ncbi:OsmC family protein [Thioalkalivibrio sp. HK1]|uniref:OsmC family protein n=1 Tax=Thioalkalivibrio sp. HK1 TaxID=1469245 RepID=UPI00046E6483|nr:OsmC family protein [Thioalkalivibrio sp. HK1]
MKASVKWLDRVAFVGESGSGHAMVIDGAPDAGGRNIGPRPLEAMLIGLGACSAFDVVNILRKSRVKFSDCRVEIEAERADAIPAVFTRIHLTFIVSGRRIREQAVERAVDLSASKYCSATAMLRESVEITHEYRIEADPLEEIPDEERREEEKPDR